MQTGEETSPLRDVVTVRTMATANTGKPTTINFLVEPTRQDWVDQALADFDTILLDHAQCERKAAGVALSLINRYPSDRELITAMTEIAPLCPGASMARSARRCPAAPAPTALRGQTAGTGAPWGTPSPVGYSAGVGPN